MGWKCKNYQKLQQELSQQGGSPRVLLLSNLGVNMELGSEKIHISEKKIRQHNAQ
jgi:hypothetical protein